MMVIETWIVMAAMAALNITTLKGLGSTFSSLRLIRLVKLARLSKMVRLLRAVPELLIIVKAIKYASRSMAVFFLLWLLIIYMFSVMFRQLTDGQEVGARYFESMPHAMSTLLLTGIFGENAQFVDQMTVEAPFLWPFIVFFLALVSLATMYMLVGVLVDIVRTVAISEKENLVVGYVSQSLRQELEKLGQSAQEMEIGQHQLQELLAEPSIMKIMQEVGVDVVVLADMLDLICEDVAKKENGTLTFPDVVDAVLGMRGTNASTVKDNKQQLRMTKTLLSQSVKDMKEYVHAELKTLKRDLQDSDSSSTDDDIPHQRTGETPSEVDASLLD